jgi:integrase
MPRPRKDGTPATKPNKIKLSPTFLSNGIKRLIKSHPGRSFAVWDTSKPGLCILVQPSGYKSWKFVYSHHGRSRWYHIGAADAIGLADARKRVSELAFKVSKGEDPLAEDRAERGRGTFEELAERYVEQCAKKNNKSWKQADALVRRHLLPKWGKLQAHAVTRADVKAMMKKIDAPIVANQTLAAASAIFAWAIKEEIVAVNPCTLIERNPTRSRERVLSDGEIPKFWAAFDSAGLVRSMALKMILLTGQRPGEVAHMRREHIIDGWWTMPGDPVPAIGWPGTKNAQTHRVWLPKAAQALLAELTDDDEATGFVFANARGSAIDGLDAAMRACCEKLGVDRATPHDLRRTHGTTIAALGFGKDILNRIENHREGGISSVYDRHHYGPEIERVMEATAARIMVLVEGGAGAGNVVRIGGRKTS